MNLPARLQYVLKLTGLSANALALKAGLPPITVSKYLWRAEKSPTATLRPQTIEAIAHAADVSTAWLAFGEGSPRETTPAASDEREGKPVEVLVVPAAQRGRKRHSVKAAEAPGWSEAVRFVSMLFPELTPSDLTKVESSMVDLAEDSAVDGETVFDLVCVRLENKPQDRYMDRLARVTLLEENPRFFTSAMIARQIFEDADVKTTDGLPRESVEALLASLRAENALVDSAIDVAFALAQGGAQHALPGFQLAMRTLREDARRMELVKRVRQMISNARPRAEQTAEASIASKVREGGAHLKSVLDAQRRTRLKG